MADAASGGSSIDDHKCHLISGAYAYMLQALLGFAALSALVVKRWKEVPKRDLRVWFYDASKQAIGGVMVHLLNIILSILMSDLMQRRSAASGLGDGTTDACALYFMNFALDMAFGIFIVWGLLRLQEALAQLYGFDSLAFSGDYGMPPSFRVYRHQLGAYLAILAIAKTVVALLMVSMGDTLEKVSDAIFYPVQDHPDVELTIVMVVCPWLLNAFQFWLMDNMLMSGDKSRGARRGTEKYSDLQRVASCSLGEGGAGGAAVMAAGSGGLGLGSGLGMGYDEGYETAESLTAGAPREPSWVSQRRVTPTAVARGRLGGGVGRGGLSYERASTGYNNLEMESYLRDRAIV